MSQFHNPFHFVPLPDGAGAEAVPLEKTEAGSSRVAPAGARHLDHGRYRRALVIQIAGANDLV